MPVEQGSDSLLEITKQAFSFKTPHLATISARRLRHQQKAAFLEKADELLDLYPGSTDEFPPKAYQRVMDKITRPVEVLVNDNTVLLHVVHYIHRFEGEGGNWVATTELAGREPESVELRSLFSVEQAWIVRPIRRIEQTLIRNSMRQIASNQDVQAGLEAIVRLEERLKSNT